jgi:hypothetical protein
LDRSLQLQITVDKYKTTVEPPVDRFVDSLLHFGMLRAPNILSVQALAWKPFEGYVHRWLQMVHWSLCNPLSRRHVVLGMLVSRGELVFIIFSLSVLLFFWIDHLFLHSEFVSFNPGQLAAIPLSLTFATSARTSVFSVLCGLPFERSQIWHIYFAFWAIVLTIHHMLENPMRKQIQDWAGVISSVVCLLMMLSIYAPIRRKYFEFFYRTHLVASVVVVVSILIHCGHRSATISIGITLWLYDVAFRFFSATTRHRRSVKLIRISGDVTRIVIPTKDFTYRAGQYIFICIPELGILQWHPFSMSCAPHEAVENGEFYLHVRALGDWTRSLWSIAQGSPTVNLMFEGPYGEPIINMEGDDYEMMIFLSGGIGITALQSRYNSLIDQIRRGRPVELCWFIWCVRSQNGAQKGEWSKHFRRKLSVLDFSPSAKIEPHLDDDASMNFDECSSFPSERELTPSFRPLMLTTLSISALVTNKGSSAKGSVSTLLLVMHRLQLSTTLTRRRTVSILHQVLSTTK